MLFESATDFDRALRRRFWIGKENQCHAIARREPHEFPVSFRSTKLRSAAHYLIELLLDLALIVNEQLRIGHHIDKQNMGNLEVKILI